MLTREKKERECLERVVRRERVEEDEREEREEERGVEGEGEERSFSNSSNFPYIFAQNCT